MEIVFGLLMENAITSYHALDLEKEIAAESHI